MPAFNWDEDKGTKYRWLVYGDPGIGKTSLSNYLKGKTYLLSLDDSFHRVKWKQKPDVWRIDTEKPIEDLIDFYNQFDSSQYDNLVIDNITKLQDLFLDEKARETKSQLDNQLKDWNEADRFLKRFVVNTCFSWDLNVLITAWEETINITDPNGQMFTKFAPSVRSKPRMDIMGSCDVVARMVKKSQSGERGLILEGTIDTYAKNRLDGRKGCKADELFSVGDN